MTETSTRTIVHYSLKLKSNRDNSDAPPHHIKACVEKVMDLPKSERKHDDVSSKKVHFLAYTSKTGTNILSGYFKSAKYDYRPPLIDKNTLNERTSPKSKSEGEEEKTHFAIKVDKDDVLLLLEQKRAGISLGTLVSYLNSHLNHVIEKHTIIAGLSVSGNFDSKLNELERAVAVDLYIPHGIVSDAFGAKAIPTKDVKKDAKITFTAERSESIKSMVYGWVNLMRNKEATLDISRIKVYGKTDHNTNVLLDTDRLKDKSTVTVALDANKQVDSDSMLTALRTTIGGAG